MTLSVLLGLSDTVPGGGIEVPIVTARWKQKSRLLSSQPLSVSSWGRLPIAAEQAGGFWLPMWSALTLQ